MTVTHVQMISVIGDTQHTRAPLQTPPPTADEAGAQVLAFVRLVSDMLTRPHASPHDRIDHRPTTLKVILAPEFYFRCPEGQPDGRGHFVQRDFIGIMGTLRTRLREVFEGHARSAGGPGPAFHQPWLVMPGTVVWSRRLASGEHVLMNTIFGLDFTDPGQPPRDHLCDKRYFSDIDGLDKWRNAARDGLARPESLGYRSDQTFTLAATTSSGQPIGVGAEICLDHAFAVLWNAVTGHDRDPALPAPPELHLHVLLACGMDVNPWHIAVSPRRTGLVLRCNGNRYNHDVGGPIRSDVYGRVRLPTGGFVWRRDLQVQAAGRIGPIDLASQRPSRPGGTTDLVGVSPSYPIG
ncbi:MAG: hypothetical protein ACK5PP_18095 [Acidimicrobiales bacterium]